MWRVVSTPCVRALTCPNTARLDYAPDHYPLFAIRSRPWTGNRPCVLVTGGVHGYETSGVHGALQFLERHAADYDGRIDLIVVPCVSPWAYERIHRWNADALDPNRSFRDDSPAQESAALWNLVAPFRDRVLVHVDLHETTDTDESEFRPALAARDGVDYEAGEIPDGFYLVDDSAHPQPEFQQAIIAAVAKVTHIAPADAERRDHRFAGGRAGCHRVPAHAARSLCRHHRRTVQDHHRGLSRQPARDAGAMQRRAGRSRLRGYRLRTGASRGNLGRAVTMTMTSDRGIFPMPATSRLDAADYDNLALVAQGRSLLLDAAATQRLLAAGLVLWMAASEVAPASLQLTQAGLALIHSSDQ